MTHVVDKPLPGGLPGADSVRREQRRLAALERLDVMDTPREESFERLARLIRDVFKVPVSLVSMIDGHRQWYKSCYGLAASEVERRETFCRHTIAGDKPLIVKDALSDERFATSRFVTGEPHIRFYAGVPLRTRDGQNIGTVCAIGYEPREFSAEEESILTTIAQMAMDEIERRNMLRTDELTGLLTRRAFKEESARALALARRHEHPLACLAVDLDGFKSINDIHGHAAGDKVLLGVARAAIDHLRQTDLVGRLGGDEFAVLLPHTDAAKARNVAEKLRARIARVKFDLGQGNVVRITASIGIAALNAHIPDLDTLLATADAALYQAKAAGRNTCVSAPNPESSEKGVRRRVLKSGRIVLNNRTSTLDCTVKTIADDGAGLDVATATGIPEIFTLVIPSDNFEKRCRIASKTDRHLEVEFF